LLGRVVAEPVAGFQEGGYHAVAWDASGLSSGVYYYRLEASGDRDAPARRVFTKTMYLLR
jgi:hypothetical protein